jgi:tRNA 2-thiouridine synthesizing protein A
MSSNTNQSQFKEIQVDESLDAVGLTCPLPLLKAKQALNKLQSGQVLSVVCTDPGSVRDFQVFAKQSGHILLQTKVEGGQYRYWLKKAG